LYKKGVILGTRKMVGFFGEVLDDHTLGSIDRGLIIGSKRKKVQNRGLNVTSKQGLNLLTSFLRHGREGSLVHWGERVVRKQDQREKKKKTSYPYGNLIHRAHGISK